MGRQRHVLALLNRLGLEKSPSCVADRGNGRVVRETLGVEGHMNHDGVIGELIQVSDGRHEDDGARRNGDEAAGADWSEDGE